MDLPAVDDPYHTTSVERKTPLHYVAINKRTQAGIVLLEAGANPNVLHMGGMTPLLYAANNGDLILIKYMVEKSPIRAEVNTKTPEGGTALHGSV